MIIKISTACRKGAESHSRVQGEPGKQIGNVLANAVFTQSDRYQLKLWSMTSESVVRQK
jgi:hypothetical protein